MSFLRSILPISAAFALAACGGSDEEGEGGPADVGEASAEAAAGSAAAVPAAIEMAPGRYQTSATLIDFNIPELTDRAKAMLRPELESSLAPGVSFCLSADEAAQGPERVLQKVAEEDCIFNAMDVNGATVSADMTCTPANAPETRRKMQGEINRESAVLRMDTVQTHEVGEVTMSVDIEATRVGDCG